MWPALALAYYPYYPYYPYYLGQLPNVLALNVFEEAEHIMSNPLTHLRPREAMRPRISAITSAHPNHWPMAIGKRGASVLVAQIR